jgi:hypothetical protein
MRFKLPGGQIHLWPVQDGRWNAEKSHADWNPNILAAKWSGKVSYFSFPHFPFALILAVRNGSRDEHPVRAAWPVRPEKRFCLIDL